MSAVSATKLSIISSALVRLGGSPISSLGDPKATAVLADETYEQTKQANLEGFRWSFALKEKVETYLDLDTHDVGDQDFSDMFTYAYQKPTNGLYVIGLLSSMEFMTTENYLWTNDNAAQILYVEDSIAGAFSAGFAHALSLDLTAQWTKPVTDKSTDLATWSTLAERAWAKARNADSTTRTAIKLKYWRLLQAETRPRW